MDIRDFQRSKSTSISKRKTEEKHFWEKEIQLFGKIISDKVKQDFYQQLYRLLLAGVDIRTALEIITVEQKKEKINAIFKELSEDILRGNVLSQALANTGHFSSYEIMSLKIGEETANLSFILQNLVLYFQKKVSLKRQIIAALTYPFIVLTVAILAISFMLGFVVPMFGDVFKRFGSDLPDITKFVISASNLFKAKAWLLAVFSILIILGIVLINRNKKLWLQVSLVALKIPVFGDLLILAELARFTGTMAILIKSKIPILDCLEFTHQIVRLEPIKYAIENCKMKIIGGESLHISMSNFSIFPRRLITLVKVGEETSQLDVFFEQLNQQYSADLEHKVSVLNKFVEPAIILLLGIFVGVILISMYLPLFKLGQTF